MVEEGLLTPAQGLALLDGLKLDAVVRTSFAQAASQPLAIAEVAGMGVASGVVALDSEAVKRACKAEKTDNSSASGDGDDGYRGHGVSGWNAYGHGRSHVSCGRRCTATREGVPSRLPRVGD